MSQVAVQGQCCPLVFRAACDERSSGGLSRKVGVPPDFRLLTQATPRSPPCAEEKVAGSSSLGRFDVVGTSPAPA